MRRIHQLAMVMAIVAFSCGKKDKLLIDQLPAEPIVNPETKVLIKNNQLLNVQYDGTEIKGFTKTDIFHTSDLFKQFSVQPYSLPANNQFFKIDGNKVISSAVSYYTPQPIIYSLDYGNTWRTITPNIPGYTPAGYWVALIDVKIFDDNTMLLLISTSETSIFVNYTVNNTWLYTVNLTTGTGQLLSSIADHMPESIHFINRNKGWMVLNKVLPEGLGYSNHNSFVSVTENGGATWSTPIMVDANEPHKLTTSKDGYLFLYNLNGGGYFSTNGTAWTKSNANHRFSDVAVISPTALYASCDAGFAKSTDGGLNWSIVTLYQYGKLSFVDEQRGIIYGQQTLYITDDGGKNWKTLLFPYPYITN